MQAKERAQDWRREMGRRAGPAGPKPLGAGSVSRLRRRNAVTATKSRQRDTITFVTTLFWEGGVGCKSFIRQPCRKLNETRTNWQMKCIK
jgi:hypothetical protein